ncbi:MULTISPECIES: hypothetical protein [unclassified Clostridium]|uniref:hypothetical protein n=1 Tax=unclassified Clostridium TaxID=2614128 RepID=UPI0025C557FE|nr:hypothetical protein [Clostridium sp.]MCI6693501.1 hypothetical protein [Clostridium sp.]MDY2632315.1 hypothetical protein [Clostridium sp.]MDY4252927.1 hypothetical protein [Clostridium sp.]MDY6226624.1 hypothetical protein [Clostridium sp.]
MINKKVLIGTLIFFIIVVLGVIKINIINTKALSPVGNGEDNYELVKEEFGKDFEEFIKDDAEVKIYTPRDEIENTTVRIYDKEFIINTNNKLTEKFYEMGGFLYNGFSSIIDKINGKIKNNEINNESEDLDKIINDFLEENNSN